MSSKKWLVILCVALSAFAASLGSVSAYAAAAERVGDFALLDETGGFHQLSRYQHRDAVVLLAYDNSCAAARDAADTLATLQSQFAGDVEFLALDINARDRATESGWGLAIPVLADEQKLVAESLQVQQAGEVLVINPQRLSLYYRGGAELLEAQGHGTVNQATLSRDLRELGIAKGPDGYVLPGTGFDDAEVDPLTRACREWLQDAIPVAHQLVAKTSPGGAHPLALALDQRSAEVPDSPIVGTLAGDDTVLMICRTPRAADRLATDLRSRLPR